MVQLLWLPSIYRSYTYWVELFSQAGGKNKSSEAGAKPGSALIYIYCFFLEGKLIAYCFGWLMRLQIIKWITRREESKTVMKLVLYFPRNVQKATEFFTFTANNRTDFLYLFLFSPRSQKVAVTKTNRPTCLPRCIKGPLLAELAAIFLFSTNAVRPEVKRISGGSRLEFNGPENFSQ